MSNTDHLQMGASARIAGTNRTNNPHPQGSNAHHDWDAGWVYMDSQCKNLKPQPRIPTIPQDTLTQIQQLDT